MTKLTKGGEPLWRNTITHLQTNTTELKHIIYLLASNDSITFESFEEELLTLGLSIIAKAIKNILLEGFDIKLFSEISVHGKGIASFAGFINEYYRHLRGIVTTEFNKLSVER